MTAIQAFILGVIQGVCEFLPISSSGHLVLLQRLFGISEGALSFDIIVHLGTLVSICVVMRKRLLTYLRNPLGHIPKMILLGTLPTVAIVLVFSSVFKAMFETGMSLGIGFIFTAALLFYAERHNDPEQGGYARGAAYAGRDAGGRYGNRDSGGRFGARPGPDGDDGIYDGPIEDKITPQGAIIVGIAQGIAVVPAISRSGSTIAGGIISNFGRKAAIEFAFLMSIPVTLMAVAQDLLKVIMNRGADAAAAVEMTAAGAAEAASMAVGPLAMLIGFVVSAVTGLFAARFMLKMITRIKLTYFSIYTGALGLLILIDQLFIGAVFEKLF